MKKHTAAVFAITCMIFLAACGGRAEDSTSVQESKTEVTQSQYSDLKVTEEQLWNQAEQTLDSYKTMGVQLYQGEPVRFLRAASGQGKGIDIYMQKKDGSLELLLEKVPEFYGQYKLLLGEDIYLYDASSIIKLDRQGREMYSTIASAAIDGLVRTVCLLPDNGLMAGAYNKDTHKMELWRMDGDTGKFEEKPFVVNEDGQSYISCGKEGAYLLSQLGVWAVDEENGRLKGEFLLEGTSYGLTFGGQNNSRKLQDFQVTDENTLKLLWKEDKEYVLETLERKPVEDKVILSMRTTNIYGEAKDWIADFNKQSDKYYIVIDECMEGTDINDFTTQTGIMLATGKGADLFYYIEMRDVMWALMEKGAFEDLKPYMEASGIREEDYFPYVFDVLRKGEQIYGIYTLANGSKYYMSTEVTGGAEAPANVEELADILLAYQEKAVLIDKKTSPQVLEWLLQGSETLWGMLDWQKGTCEFDGELFSKLLEVSKRYGYDEKNDYPALLQKLNLGSFYGYVQSEELLTGDYVEAGPYFEDGCYPIADDYATLYVNGASDEEHKAGAWEFIKFWLSSEVQQDYTRTVHKESFRKQAEERIAEDKALELKGSLYAPPLTAEKAENMEKLLDSTRHGSMRIAALLEIVTEEASAYYNGTKTVSEVTQIIENRVRLYLQENAAAR